MPRYAIYFAPPTDSALWRFGSAVIGYDGATGEDVPQLVPPGVDAPRFHALTADPRLYAFHATIKAPFRLRAGVSEADVATALAGLAGSRRAFALPSLVVEAVDRRAGEGAFMALVEPQTTPELAALERAVVEAFEPFRAPLSERDFAKRRPEHLSPRQRHYLETYGYPYVFEEFRFHMTLTNRVPEPEADVMLAGLSRLYAEAVPAGPVVIDGLAIFRQMPGERFRILCRQAFAG